MENSGGTDQTNSAGARSSGRDRREQEQRAQAPTPGHQTGDQEWRVQMPTLAHLPETQDWSAQAPPPMQLIDAHPEPDGLWDWWTGPVEPLEHQQ